MNTTLIASYTENDGTVHFFVTVDRVDQGEVSAERAALIIEQRLAAGWKVWRDVRDEAGRPLDVMLILS